MTTTTDTATAIVELTYGERLVIALPNYRGDRMIDNDFTFGSVAGYAAAYNDDVEAAVERAIRLNHQLYYMFNEGVTITAHAQVPVKRVRIELGDTVAHDGKTFIVKPDANNNVKLVEVI